MSERGYIILESELDIINYDIERCIYDKIRSRPTRVCFGKYDGRWDACIACPINFDCIEQQRVQEES